MRGKRLITSGGLLLVLLSAGVGAPAHAFRFDIGGIQASWENRITAGAIWRTEERDESLVGKLNVNPDLCPDDCLSFNGDPAPNQRLVDAPGAFVGTNYDNGNLNYDQGDVVSSQARIESELKGFWGDVAFKVSAIGFYDGENSDFSEYNPDTAFQPSHVERPSNIEEQVGHDIDILEGFINVPFDLFGHNFDFTIGEQRLRWGESTFIARGSVDALNPPNENRLHFPGSQIASVFEPVGLAVLSTQLSSNVTAEFVYQYDWEPVAPAAEGSFFSTVDFAGGGDYAVISLGQFSEDPNQVGTFKGLLPRLVTSTSTSVPVEQVSGRPEQGGQYGMRLTWFADNINGGTEFAFHALNYHSRFPYGSVVATDKSCLRDSPTNGLLGATIACRGFNGLLTAPFNFGREPLPIDTLGVFLDYPEDIHMFGLSFNTNVGNWSVAGEYSYRPNMPLQVSIPDVVFAGLQPALPAEDMNLLIATVPGARNAAPDYVSTRYRNDPVAPNETIRGYERQEVGQFDLTGIRIFSSSNPIGADQIVWLLEAGFTHVLNMPDRDSVQFDGGGPNCTHYSPGADGTGQPNGEPDPRSLNPTQARGCFADDFAWGWRTMVEINYSNLVFGWSVKPRIFLSHDVDGVAPFPVQNFVEERKRVLVGTSVQFTPAFQGEINYDMYFGSGETRNRLADRDNISLAFSYNF